MCSEFEAENFTTLVMYRSTQRWQKCVGNDGDFVEKEPFNWKRCMNRPCKFRCYCNYTLRKMGGGTFVAPFMGKTSS
jgi:hypothetical protein